MSTSKFPIQIPKGTIFIVVEGDGVCDYCFEKIKGSNISKFKTNEAVFDLCDECKNNAEEV